MPNPTYPIHSYCVVIAGGDLRSIPLTEGEDFFERLQAATKLTWPKPKMLIINFPHNPTTMVVDRSFFEKVIQFAQENQILVVHDLAYADLVFDGYKAPSILQIPGAKELAVEFYTPVQELQHAWMAGGFCRGEQEDDQCPGETQELLRLRDVSTHPDCGHHRPERRSVMRARNKRDLLLAPGCPR